jgi:hypothetical protein
MTTPIEKFLEKYQNKMPFEYINFKPKEPIKVIWWGVQKIAIISDVNTGEPKEVVQLLVKDVSDEKYKIITTTSFSLLKQLAEMQKDFVTNQKYELRITQFKESSPAGKFKTYYKVEKISAIEGKLDNSDKEAEQTFLYGEIEEIEQ